MAPRIQVALDDPAVARGRFAEAIDALAQRTELLPKQEFLKLSGQARSKAWTVARVTDMQIMKDLHGAAGQAVEGGQSWREFIDSLQAIRQQRGWSGLEPWHAQVVYETNVNQAWTAGRVTQARDAGVRYWRKLPSDSRAERAEHARLNGQIFAFSELSPPPWDFGCKCGWEVVFDDEVPADVRRKAEGARGRRVPRPTAREYEFDAADFTRPIELRQGDFPEELWPVIRSLASDANALLRLRR